MGKLLQTFILLSVVLIAVLVGKYALMKEILVKIPHRQWFGEGPSRADDPKIEKFKISVPNNTLEDLEMRLKHSRFFESLENADNFHYGFNTDYLRTIRDHWLYKYDWRKYEADLNEFEHFQTEIEGIKVHFIRSRPLVGKYTKIVPLLLVHGWPGSVWEFHKILPLLSDPNGAAQWSLFPGGTSDWAFDVVAPSIPGYGWSTAPKKTGFGALQAGRVFSQLMARLGFRRFYCQGGDWGSVIVTGIAVTKPERVLGLHLNMFTTLPFDHPAMLLKSLVVFIAPSLILDPLDIPLRSFGEIITDFLEESGYFHLQATKPDTIGFSLNDSPLGLAAYILEKFTTWTARSSRDLPDGGLTSRFSLDELLTNVMIYWINGNIAYSQRFYKETMISPFNDDFRRAVVKVPTGLAAFPNELLQVPLNFASYKFLNITRYIRMPRGGHFAAFEEPKLLATDVFAFVNDLN